MRATKRSRRRSDAGRWNCIPTGRAAQARRSKKCRKPTECGTAFSDFQPLEGVRIDSEKAAQVVNLLIEGVGIRAISRLTGLHQETVLNVLATAGEHCAKLLDERVRNVQLRFVQIDELWAFVWCKERHNRTKDYYRGDQYLFLGIDAESKLIISHTIGKRDSGQALDLIEDLSERIQGRLQVTTDGFEPYRTVMPLRLGDRVDFAQLIKQYSDTPDGAGPERRYSPGVCTGVRVMMRCGTPDPSKISTSYVERTNLSVRLFYRRFTRLTLGFSKKVEYLKHSVALLIAHFNFCREHSAHSQTPAQAAGLTDHPWSISELLNYGSSYRA
jgi:IS1 family transposase